jgi:hypothetical protein
MTHFCTFIVTNSYEPKESKFVTGAHSSKGTHISVLLICPKVLSPSTSRTMAALPIKFAFEESAVVEHVGGGDGRHDVETVEAMEMVAIAVDTGANKLPELDTGLSKNETEVDVGSKKSFEVSEDTDVVRNLELIF